MKTQTRDRQNQQNQSDDTSELVQQRAYELYVQRGQESGHELEDWLQAEREISEKQERQSVR